MDITLIDCNDDKSRVELYNINKKPSGFVNLSNIKAKAMTGRDAKSMVDAVKSQVFNHMDKRLGTPGGTTRTYFAITINNTINNVIVVAPEDPEKPKDFALIRLKLEMVGERDCLKKRDGSVYEPVEGCPCAYVVRCTFADYINTVLEDDAMFNADPRRFDELMKYMANYNRKVFPRIKPDLDLLSFSNGVLQLANGVFTEYETLDKASEMAQRVARHHIPLPYTGEINTPLLDTILGRQFGVDVAEVLCALIGRCFFKVNQRDGWQVMPFIVGIGGTGKSLLLKIVERMFAPGSVGNLGTKREEVFGMANIADKELVMGRDMPAKMSGCLSQDNLQSMTAGEGMEIPRKGLTSQMINWTSPIIMASNHMPDYVNTGNNIGRRIVSFRFDNMVQDPREDLEELILEHELPNIIARCLTAYTNLKIRVLAAKGFWNAMPPEMQEWKHVLAAATNTLEEFLAMGEGERNCAISCVKGALTGVQEFKDAFARVMSVPGEKKVAVVMDAAVLFKYGFSVSATEQNVCVSCKRLAKAGRDACCEEYKSTSKRSKKKVIFNMLMTDYDE